MSIILYLCVIYCVVADANAYFSDVFCINVSAALDVDMLDDS